MGRLGAIFLLLFLAACQRSGCSPNLTLDAAATTFEAEGGVDSSFGGRPLEEGWEVVDPYCGMRLRRSEAAATAVHRGKTYHFCMSDHREAFLRDPDLYLSPAQDGGVEGEGRRAARDSAPD